jgi:FtsH-binding integral membrane protein
MIKICLQLVIAVAGLLLAIFVTALVGSPIVGLLVALCFVVVTSLLIG